MRFWLAAGNDGLITVASDAANLRASMLSASHDAFLARKAVDIIRRLNDTSPQTKRSQPWMTALFWTA